MSICNCPVVPKEQQQALVDVMLQISNLRDWSLLSLQDMYNAGNSLQHIAQVIPFRGGPCSRTSRCCGVCTRRCNTRCIQDCLHRLYMWRSMVEHSDGEHVPLAIQYAVTQKFETLADMSWVVGDILSSNSNTTLKEYMKHANLRPEENPYKIDYAPQVEVNPDTGKRVVNPVNGELSILQWPRTGLCPYCLPRVTVDRRVGRKDT